MMSVSVTSESGTISAATTGKAADDGSAGTTTFAPCSSGWPVSEILRPLRAFLGGDDFRSEMGQHHVRYGRGWLPARSPWVTPRRGQARQQHRRLDLRRRHRRAIDDRERIARALQRHGQPSAVAARHHARAHLIPADRESGASARPRSDPSPSKVAAIGDPATAPIARRHPVPLLPKSSGASGAAKPADADSTDRPSTIPGALDFCPERRHRLGGVENVLALQKPRNPGLSHRQGTQNQGPVRDRFVARNTDAAAQSACGARFQRRRVVGMGQNGISFNGHGSYHAFYGASRAGHLSRQTLLTAAAQLAK